MKYSVHELFYSIQGEGAQAGRPAVFCRFAGCNLWSGREEDRASAVCQFCDTEFVGTEGEAGGVFEDAGALADAVERFWPEGERGARFVVCTGGEPALQMDAPLIEALHARAFTVAIETNGTRALPTGIDWICVSPKAGADLVQRRGNELKLVYPQQGTEPAAFERLAFQHFFLQPIDGPEKDANTAAAIEYCLRHPKWRLSVQRHKFLGMR